MPTGYLFFLKEYIWYIVSILKVMRNLFFCFILVFCPYLLFSQNDNVGSGRAIKLDGVDDYIDLGNIYDDLTLPFSISAWIYIDPNTTAAGPVFVSQDNAPIYNGFWFFATPTTVFIEYGDGRGENLPAYRKGKTCAVPYMKGRWNHVCAVMKTAYDIDLYVNGFDVGGSFSGDSDQPMSSLYPNDIAKIGFFLSNGVTYRFQGIIDEIRIWNLALSESKIRQTMCKKLVGNEPGLIGYWTFDEIGGSNILDKSANNFHGQLKGNPTRVYSGAPLGNESLYSYTDNWLTKTLSITVDDYTFGVNNVRGNPYGVHIYAVTDLPSQTNGLSPGAISEPYFGAFIVSDDDDNLFDASYLYNGQEPCESFTRSDNSSSDWKKNSPTLKDKNQRGEFVSIMGPKINLDLGEDKTICDQSTHSLQTNISDPALTFQWSTGQNTSQISVSKTGTYWVKVSSDCGSLSDTINVVIDKYPKEISLPEDQSLCTIRPSILQPVDDPSGLDFTWQDGSKLPTFEVVDFGSYWVTVRNACGEVRDTIIFSKVALQETLIPNVITPNGDQYNEKFLVNEEIKGLVSLEVYNRWGHLIYRSSNYNNDWGGIDLSTGTYFYRLSGNCVGEKKGTLSILK